jgi:hypothetical protein
VLGSHSAKPKNGAGWIRPFSACDHRFVCRIVCQRVPNVQRPIAGRLAIVAVIGAISCHSPTSPITGQDAVMVVDVVLANGGIAPLRGYVVAHVQFQVTSDLEGPTVFTGFPVPVSYQVWVCLSADGIHFASDCQGVSGSPGTPVQCAVDGPTAGPTQTSYVLAFMIKTSDYDFEHPSVAGGVIPAFAIAQDVKPWVINWQ